MCAWLPVKYWSAAPQLSGGTTAHIHLDAVACADAGFAFTGLNDLCGECVRCDGIGDGGGVLGFGGDGNVDVANGFPAPAEASAILRVLHAGERFKKRHEFERQRQGIAETNAAAACVEMNQIVLDLLELFVAKALDACQRACFDACLEILDRCNAALVPEDRRRLGSDGGNSNHLHHADGNLRKDIIKFRNTPGAKELVDFFGGAFTDARDGFQRVCGGELRHVIGKVFKNGAILR